MTNLYPLPLTPSLHPKVWGGRRLGTHLHKALPDGVPYGESWELHDTATIAAGALAGRTLAHVLAEYGTALVGAGNDPAAGFPLLAKFLDATAWLSVQVHPNDEQAAALEGEPRGKTEAWIVLAAEPGAKLVCGLRPGTPPTAMAQAIENGTLEAYLVFEPVQTGDVLLLEANTVHAIGPGLLVYEIQQASDTTYRLYDWNRVGLDGKPRDLHIDKGVSVSNLSAVPQTSQPWATPGDVITLVERQPYFRTDLHRLHGDTRSVVTHGRFHALTCLQGAGQVQAGDDTVALPLGQTVLIPACLDGYTLSGQGEVVCSYQPGQG